MPTSYKKKKRATLGKDSPTWFKLFPARWAALAMAEPDDAKLGALLRWYIRILCAQEVGAAPFTDTIINTAVVAMKTASNHGTAGSNGRWGKSRSRCRRNAQVSPGEPVPCSSIAKRIEGEEQESPTTIPNPKSVSDSGDSSSSEPIPNPITKDSVWVFPDPARLAAAFCGEEANQLTRNTFAKRYREIEDHAFREELGMFISEVDQGEKPKNLGAAFNKRLSELAEKVKIRKAIQDDLKPQRATK